MSEHPPVQAVCDTCGRREWLNGRCFWCQQIKGQDLGYPVVRACDAVAAERESEKEQGGM